MARAFSLMAEILGKEITLSEPKDHGFAFFFRENSFAHESEEQFVEDETGFARGCVWFETILRIIEMGGRNFKGSRAI